MRYILAAIPILLLAGSVVWAVDEEEKEKKASFWMEQKLSYSQSILEGLATADFDAIHKSATAMKGLNRIESFVRRKPEGYRTQLRVFQFSLDELVRHSEADDLEGATLAFTQMTISCVNCHKHLRDN